MKSGRIILLYTLFLSSIGCQTRNPTITDAPRLRESCTCISGGTPDDYTVTLELTDANGELLQWEHIIHWIKKGEWPEIGTGRRGGYYESAPESILDVAIRDADKTTHHYCYRQPQKDANDFWVLYSITGEMFVWLNCDCVQITWVKVRQLPLSEMARQKKEYGEAYEKAQKKCKRHRR